MKKITILLSAIALALVVSQTGMAQRNKDLKQLEKQVESLQKGQAEMQKELKEIKSLLEALRQSAGSKPQEISLNVEGLPFKGDKNARLTIVEFSDYQCPFCARYVRETLPQIIRDYASTGKVKYVFSDFPLDSMHPQALKAAEAAACAGDQGKFWEMHDQLFSNQHALDMNTLSLHAQAIGINTASFQQCLFSGKHESKVRESVNVGSNAGVNGTPTFFIGTTNSSSVKVLKVVSGAQPYSVFKSLIESLLSSQNSERSR